MTSDGNAYLTSQQLLDKIKDELYIHGGRANTVDLAKELNVDLDELNLNVSKIVRAKEVHLVAESLISHYYFKEIAREINLMLQIQGQISVDDLTLQFDLPSDVLQHDVLEKYLGTIISGTQDPSDPTIFYTEQYITRTKAKLRGALMGLLKPTLVLTILQRFNLPEGLFFYLFDQLNDSGVITENYNVCFMKYLPSIHTKSQNDWLIGFYKINRYLEYHTLTYFDIPYEKEHVKQLLHNEDMIFLNRCVMDIQLQQNLKTALQECIASKSYLNVESFLNFSLCDEDVETFLVPLLKSYTSSIILFDKMVFSKQFIETVQKVCLPIIQKNAESAVMSGKYQQYLEEQLAKKNHQYVSVDNKDERFNQVVQDSDFDEVSNSENTPSHLELISIEDVENTIKETFEDEKIAEYILGQLNQTGLAIAKKFFEKLFGDDQNRKCTPYSSQNRINVLMNDIYLYEKGFKLFPSDQQPQFIEYLLKSLGGDVLSEFCKYAANQCNLSVQADVLSVGQRNKIINDLSEEYMKPLCALNSVLTEQNMDQFYQAVDVCSSEWGMFLKKINKKKERLVIHYHIEKLLTEIENCEEPALVLHLVVLVLFTIVTQNMLHASGRQVPLIILFLKSQLKEDDFDKIQKYNEMVANYLIAADEEKESIEEKLKEGLSSLKSIVTDVTKYSTIIETE